MASNASPDHVAVDIPDEPIKEQSPHARNYEIVTQNQFFHQVVESAGRWAFGVIFVEVWVLNEAKTHLFRPEDGWWIDYYAHDCGGNSQFDRLIDPTRPDYIEPAPLAPGVGISGVLWAEVQGGNAANQNDHLERNVEWREIKPLSDDPDQPYNPRLKYLAEIGLGWAAGVPFKVGENQGIVVYMARESASVRKLTDSINENYLTHSTLLIGSAYSLGAPRLAAENARRTENHDTLKRVMNKIRALKAMNITLDVLVHEESQRPNKTEQQEGIGTDTVQGNACEDGFNYVVGKVRISVRKFFGANVKAPPKFTWEQTACTFFSALVTLAILTNINVALIKNYGESHSIVLGPFGALMTLQYGLTAAPASQPRNAIVGQTIGLLIAHGVGQVENMDPWLKQTLATSLAISAMVKFGVTHPPAGAAALLFSNGNRTWQQIGLMILGNVIAIVCAAIFNNLSERRQYPTFWGLRPMHDLVFGDKEAEEEKKKK